jgi:transposase-like protein
MRAIVPTCVAHLIRDTFHPASRRDWDAFKRDVKPVYTAVNIGALDQLAEKRGQRHDSQQR